MSTRPPIAKTQDALPGTVNDFVLALMRAINTGRLYAPGHDLLARHIKLLNGALQKAMTGRDSLFVGLGRDAIFFEGSFYKAKDPSLRKFLTFFHFLGISYLLIGKRISSEELEAFVTILAGAKKGEGRDVVVALGRENVKNARIGLLDYAVFSTLQEMASRMIQEKEDEALWLQLILQPAGSGSFDLSEEQTQWLILLCHDPKGLREMFLKLDQDLEGISLNQRGILFNNFIHNVGNILSRVDTAKRKSFAVTMVGILDSLGSRLKVQILGSTDPDDFLDRESDIVGEVLDELKDDQFLEVLQEAVREVGIRSAAFNNLFKSAISRYRDPDLLLESVRAKIRLAAEQRASQDLAYWQNLEQVLVRHKETAEFHARYRDQIEGLAASISIKGLTVEDQEIDRLLRTLGRDSLRRSKAGLIIDLISQGHEGLAKDLLPPLLDRLGELLGQLLGEKEYGVAGDLVKDVYLALGDYPEGHPVREKIDSLLSSEDVKPLFHGLLDQCNTYDAKQTGALDALCHLFPLKAGDLLTDLFLGLDDDQGDQARWIRTSLTRLGPQLGKQLIHRFEEARDQDIPRLLDIAILCGSRNMVAEVIGFLQHPAHDVRLKAIEAAGALRAEEAVPLLKETALHKSFLRTKKQKSLQAASVNALAGIGTESARKVLEQVIREGPRDLRSLCQDLT